VPQDVATQVEVGEDVAGTVMVEVEVVVVVMVVIFEC